jgi:hypothetical protein
MTVKNNDGKDLPEPPTLAVEWWHKNQWFNQPGQEMRTRLAKSIDHSLDEEGYDNETPEYYAELDRRLRVRSSVISKLNDRDQIYQH